VVSWDPRPKKSAAVSEEGDAAGVLGIVVEAERGHVLAVESRPEPEEMAVPSAPLFSLLHRLIPVIVLSSKVPATGCVCKESVKVRTPESPPSTDYSPLDLSALDGIPHRACAESEYVRGFTQREQAISNRRRRVSLCNSRGRYRRIFVVQAAQLPE
jgi:hypothetical protein